MSVGIDTWAVDFVLLDKDDQRIGNAVAYRDDRTKGMDEEVYRTVPEEELYASTGIQKQIFNSIYQLMAWKKKNRNSWKSRDSSDDSGLPEFPAFRRESAGIYQCDNNPACQPGNRRLEQGDDSKTGISGKIFLPIREPGTVIGPLKKKSGSRSVSTVKLFFPQHTTLALR